MDIMHMQYSLGGLPAAADTVPVPVCRVLPMVLRLYRWDELSWACDPVMDYGSRSLSKRRFVL